MSAFTSLVKAFNRSSVFLYMAAEIAQHPNFYVNKFILNPALPIRTFFQSNPDFLHSLYNAASAAKLSVYDPSSPFQMYLKNHLSDFFGAYALAYACQLLTQGSLPKARNSELIYAPAAMALLTFWELTHINKKIGFDWGDMAVYSAALAIVCGLDKMMNRAPNDKRKETAPASLSV